MAKSKTNRKRTPKHVLKLPDLEQSKSAVLNSLTSQSSQRTYDHAIREFIEWYCSEPRLAFNKTVVPGTEYLWNSGTMLQLPSTCGWLRSGGWPTRLPIAVCLVRTWLRAFAG
jgi:hypothetical protein